MSTRPLYPFSALVGQEEMKLALLLAVVDPRIGGVLVFGHRGTAKSTAVRGLAALVPQIEVVSGCPYQSRPEEPCGICSACTQGERVSVRIPVPMVDLPLGSTEDRVAGTIDLEAALVRGEKAFEPGLLARANRGFLYIDEVNLLEDHLVDLLLDVAAAGENIVEREAISVRHDARFVLVGSGNPEEGELRPQLLDRFGLSVKVTTETDPEKRKEIVKKRLAFDDDPREFVSRHESETARLRQRIVAAKEALGNVKLEDDLLLRITRLNGALSIDGHRGELTLARAATARAALAGKAAVELADARAVAPASLRHRLRRDPLETGDGEDRIQAAIKQHLS
jgi:magnesium chelatase subunit I